MLKAVLILIINLMVLKDEHLNNVIIFIQLVSFLNTRKLLILNKILYYIMLKVVVVNTF